MLCRVLFRLINVLDTLLIGMFAVGAVLIFLVALEVAVTTLMVSMGTLLLSVSFAYAATLQELFDSLYMIFVSTKSLDGGSRLLPTTLRNPRSMNESPRLTSNVCALHGMTHTVKPFNIGDMVLISEGSPLQVEYVGLLGTVFISASTFRSRWQFDSPTAHSFLPWWREYSRSCGVLSQCVDRTWQDRQPQPLLLFAARAQVPRSQLCHGGRVCTA